MNESGKTAQSIKVGPVPNKPPDAGRRILTETRRQTLVLLLKISCRAIMYGTRITEDTGNAALQGEPGSQEVPPAARVKYMRRPAWRDSTRLLTPARPRLEIPLVEKVALPAEFPRTRSHR